MGFTITPRASYKPLGRQPFRPGQWQGYKAASKHTTYIQNNFFGSGYSTGMNYGNYGNYGSYCNHDNGMSKGMKWLLGLGVGTTLLGGILKMFGVGGNKETGATEQPQVKSETAINNDAIVARNTKPEKTEETPEEKGAVEKKPAEKEPENNGIKWNDIKNMTCRDNSGKTLDITGKLTLGDNGNPPKSFTITDQSSGNVYKFELTSAKDGDKPVYTCTSRNGQAASSDNQYTLETKADGTPELVQYENQDNYSTGLKFGSVANNGGGAEKTFSKTISINTSVGPTTVTVTANSQKELDEKVTAEEEKSKQWQGVTDSINGKTNNESAIPNAFSNPWSQFVTTNTNGNQANKPAEHNTKSTMDTIRQKYGFKDGDKFIVNKQIKADKSGFTYTLTVNGQTHKITMDEYKELQNASGIKG